MSNRRKTPAERNAKRSRASRPSTSQFQSFATGSGFNRLARSSCSECGAPIEWVDEAEARRRDFDVDQARQFVGASTLEVWFCTSPACGEAGAMSA